MVHGGLIAIYIILVLVIITISVAIAIYSGRVSKCENQEAAWCYNLACPNPGGINPQDPCAGYAQRKTDDGHIQCANGSTKILKIGNCNGTGNCP